MRDITRHIVHCSDSTFGDAAEIRRWHVARGWRDIGYHFVILPSGEIEAGRSFWQVGAHCRGYNTTSVGTCLIGKHNFTAAQFASLRVVDEALRHIFPNLETVGHCELDNKKTCPNFAVRDVLKG